MKKENLSKVLKISSELECISKKLVEISELQSKLKKPQLPVDLRVEDILFITNIQNVFTQSDILSICKVRRKILIKRKDYLEKQLEEL